MTGRGDPARDMEAARAIARQAAALGGRAYYVGGFVRDRLLGRENTDVDIEVHGLTPSQLEEILDGLGGRLEMGASFGIYGLKGYGLDIAMPRRERAIGRGHRDFDVTVDPFLGTEQAARRRDFTVNALMEDVLTGRVLDHFHGVRDLRRGVLRHVDDRTFPEDPLRVLRGAQFAARFGFTAAPETIALCRGIDLSALPPERAQGPASGGAPLAVFRDSAGHGAAVPLVSGGGGPDGRAPGAALSPGRGRLDPHHAGTGPGGGSAQPGPAALSLYAGGPVP